MEGLRAIRSDRIREVRGLGLLVGVELKENAARALRALQDEGVLALGAGPTVVRFLPPLVISQEQIERVLAASRKVLA
jgi:acetylornithine/LysW-gamma-L-lysine aminotransferase